jgi:hypothetical protein
MSDHLKLNLVRAAPLIQIGRRMHYFAYRLCPPDALWRGIVRGMAPSGRRNRPSVADFCVSVERRSGVRGARLDCIHRQTNCGFDETKNLNRSAGFTLHFDPL